MGTAICIAIGVVVGAFVIGKITYQYKTSVCYALVLLIIIYSDVKAYIGGFEISIFEGFVMILASIALLLVFYRERIKNEYISSSPN